MQFESAQGRSPGSRNRTCGVAVEPTAVRALHGDDDFSSGVSLFQIADGLGGLTQRVRSVDDRRDLSGFHELLQNNQVVLVDTRNEEEELLAHEP